MAKVRVWNDNVYPYKETFKGDPLVIGSKSYIEMEEEDAVQFRGTFAPMVRDADGNDMPQGFKMIRIEKITAEMLEAEAAPKVDPNVCLVCKYKAGSQADLDEHLKAAHSEQLVVDEEAEAELKKRPRGRPAKQAS